MPKDSPIQNLTPREKEVLRMIAEGLSLAEIAGRLDRKQKTIESHRLSLGRKLNASNRVELTRIAISSGFVSLKQPRPRAQAGDPKRSADRTLRTIDAIHQSTQQHTGRSYIDALCKAVCEQLEVNICGICVSADEYGENHRFVVAIQQDGQVITSFFYSTKGTPIPAVIKQGSLYVEDGLAEAYPTVSFYKDLELRSYFGMRVDGDYGAKDCVLAIADNKPMTSPDDIEKVLQFFRDRTASELSLLYKNAQIKALKAQVGEEASPPLTLSDQL